MTLLSRRRVEDGERRLFHPGLTVRDGYSMSRPRPALVLVAAVTAGIFLIHVIAQAVAAAERLGISANTCDQAPTCSPAWVWRQVRRTRPRRSAGQRTRCRP